MSDAKTPKPSGDKPPPPPPPTLGIARAEVGSSGYPALPGEKDMGFLAARFLRG